ncbi:MAG: hypothetical protein ACI9XR_000405 [Flavobacterium sp.]|jgi:hypothetical protein
MVSNVGFSQTFHFQIENKNLIWQKTFPTFEKDVMKMLIKNNNKISNFSEPNKGAVNNAVCDCKLLGFMNNQTFDFIFDLDITESNYTIVVRNIKIDVDNELDYADNAGIERMFLNYGRTNLQKSERNQNNLECFDRFLSKIFELPLQN